MASQNKIPKKVIEQCKSKLLAEKEEILNTLKTNSRPPDTEERSGDFGDQNNRAMNEHQWLLFQNRMRKQLVEVESALSRLESNSFGLCEETEMPIETPRLLAIPWTRFSIEGARLRESSLK